MTYAAKMQCIVFIILNVFITIFCCAETTKSPSEKEPTNSGAQPQISVDSATYDFGIRETNDIVDHDYILTNKGTAPLQILLVEVSCGCTTTHLDKNVILPGESQKLTVHLSLVNRSGMQKKTITVNSNDPLNPTLLLYLTGEAKPLITISPNFIEFLAVPGKEMSEQVAEISAENPTEFQIEKISFNSTALKIDKEIVTPGLKYRLHIKATLPTDGKMMSDTITVKTSHPKVKDLYFSVLVRPQPNITCSPQTVRIKRTQEFNGPFSFFLAIQSPSGLAFSVMRIIPPDPSINIKIEKISPSLYRLNFLNVFYKPELQGQNIAIETDTEYCGNSHFLIPMEFTLAPNQEQSHEKETSNP